MNVALGPLSAPRARAVTRSRAWVVLALLAVVGCKSAASDATDGAAPKSSGDRAAAAAAAKASAWAGPAVVPPEHTEPLTVARVVAAKSILAAPQSEPKVYPLLLAQLGKPTRTLVGKHPLLGKEQKRYQWAAKSETTCATYNVVEQPNTLAGWPSFLSEDTGSGSFDMPKTLPTTDDKTTDLRGAWEKYTRCLALLGDKPGLPADEAGAPGPAAVATKADIVAGVRRAPSRWLGKTVTVEGLTQGSETLRIETTKGMVACRARAGAATSNDPPKKRRVRGTVADLRIDTNAGADLVDCEVVR